MKNLTLTLVNDIDTLIFIQERIVQSIKGEADQNMIDLQTDILNVLKIVQEMEPIDLDKN